MVRKRKKKTQEITAVTEPMAFEATSADDLRSSLEEIKAYEGVIGYILRNSASAAIDLKDPSKIIDYAILSSSAFEASEELSELFKLGEVTNIVVLGEEHEMLSLTVDENKISIFMEKDAGHEKIVKRLRPH